MRAHNKFAMTLCLVLLSASACGGSDAKPSEEDVSEKIPQSQTRIATASHSNTIPSQPLEIEREEESKPPAIAALVTPEPETYSQYMKRGRDLSNDGEPQQALLDYQQAAQMAPNAAMPEIQQARMYLTLGETGQAREHIAEAIEMDSTSSFAWNTMGRVEMAERDYEAAIVSFARAVDEDPDNSYAWNNLGLVYLSTEDYLEAVQALERATSGVSPKAYMWNNLGMAYEHLNDLVLARASYDQAIGAGSDRAQANYDRLIGVVSLVPAIVPEDPSNEIVPAVDENGEVEGAFIRAERE